MADPAEGATLVAKQTAPEDHKGSRMQLTSDQHLDSLLS